MIDESATQQPVQVRPHRLATFGTLALVAPGEDTLLGKHGHHRRRLALLAVLAAAGDRGQSRDQLLLLFWPEATQARARHSLDQLLYALRGSIGESVFAGVNPVRLNPDVVRSDVGAFLAAIDRGDLEAAVAEYKGPFLDGFYLSDAPEFERWVDTERARLATTYSGLLERLARTAEAARDHNSAVRWWRALSEADPLSSKQATGLMRALMNAGDRAAALQYAERYEKLVAQELGMSADPAVAELVAEVRTRTERELVSVPVSESQPIASEPARAVPLQNGATPVLPEPRVPVRRHLAAYAIGALILAVLVATAAALRAKMSGDRLVTPGEVSIAVLPLANVSRDQQDAAIVDGLTEQLIAVLAKIPNLRVMARTSAFAFKNSDLGVRRIADSLGVTNILEGGVQRIGSRLRVQVRLIDGRDGSTRWAEIYDRELRDIFAVQSDIAGEVARELDLRLHGDLRQQLKRPPTRNIVAYELYLRGNDPALTRSDSAARLGLEYFRQAIALDPSYAAAYAGLARMQMRVGLADTMGLQREQLALAERAALGAVALDDSLGEAHAALGLVRRNNYDMVSAESELKRAVALEPTSARFREWLVQLYILTERPSDALAEARRALQLDPLSPTANAEWANALLANGRCDEALAHLGKLSSLRPPLLRARSTAAQCYALKQMWPEAIAELQRNSPDGGSRNQALLGYMLARAGRTDEARQILAVLLDRSRRSGGGAFNVAAVYAGMGENDQAFTWLDKAVDDRSFIVEYFQTILQNLRSDPRFDRIRERVGLQKR